MTKFIDLPNGDSIRADAIYAVRVGDAEKLNHSGTILKPRVIVDFGLKVDDFHAMYGMHQSTNCSIVEFEDNEDRDCFKLSLMLQLRYDNPKGKPLVPVES